MYLGKQIGLDLWLYRMGCFFLKQDQRHLLSYNLKWKCSCSNVIVMVPGMGGLNLRPWNELIFLPAFWNEHRKSFISGKWGPKESWVTSKADCFFLGGAQTLGSVTSSPAKLDFLCLGQFPSILSSITFQNVLMGPPRPTSLGLGLTHSSCPASLCHPPALELSEGI